MERPTAYFFLGQQMLRLYLPRGLIPCFSVFGAGGFSRRAGGSDVYCCCIHNWAVMIHDTLSFLPPYTPSLDSRLSRKEESAYSSTT